MKHQNCSACGSPSQALLSSGLCARCVGAFAFRVEELNAPVQSTSSSLSASVPGPLNSPSPERIGDYEIIQEIARGGMGVVYKARQISLNRVVALKMIQSVRLADETAVRRFRTEAAAAAKLRHPHIVPIYEVGQEGGQHFYSMAFVPGTTLAQRLEGTPLPANLAARYLRTIADAIHYAHEHSVLHRDIKPGNVLIDDDDEPHVTDFGLAKLMDGDSSLTITGVAFGSPSYMAPEQAQARHRDMNAGSDVYSLGAMLYEMLTGRPPFRGITPLQTARMVCETEPVSPRLLNPSTPLDLETICLKCLQKEPARRYQTAQELAEELQRFERGEPVQARPIGRTEKATRWCRRNPMLATMILAVNVVVAIGLAGILWQWRKATDSARRETVQRQWTEQALLRSELQRTEDLFAKDKSQMAAAALARLLRQHPTNLAVATRLMSALSYRNWLLPVAPALAETNEIRTSEFSRDGRSLLTVGGGAARVWEVGSGAPAGPPLRRASDIKAAIFHPDGVRVLLGQHDGTVRIVNAFSGEDVVPAVQHGARITALSFSSNGSRFASGSEDRTACVWSTDTGQRVAITAPHDTAVWSVKLSPDGQRLATTSEMHFYLWNAANGEPEHGPLENFFDLQLTFSHDGRFLLCSSRDSKNRTARCYDASNGALQWKVRLDGIVWSAQFNPNSTRVVTGWSSDRVGGVARQWDAGTGQPIGVEMKHEAGLRSAEFSPVAPVVLTSWDYSARLWDTESQQPASEPFAGDFWKSTRFSPDGRRVVTGPGWLWDTAAGTFAPLRLRFSARILSAGFSADGGNVAIFTERNTALVTIATGEILFNQVARVPRGCILLSPDQSAFMALLPEGARVMDMRTGQAITPVLESSAPLSWAAFSPDSTCVLTAARDGSVQRWNARTGTRQGEALVHLAEPVQACYSPDGKRIAVLSKSAFSIWDAATGALCGSPIGLDFAGALLAFSPDGQQLVIAGGTTMRVRHIEGGAWTARATTTLPILEVQFSADSRLLFATTDQSWQKNIQFFDAQTGDGVPNWTPEPNVQLGLNHARHGEQLLLNSADRTLTLWNVRTRQMIAEPIRQDQRPVVAFYDDSGLAVAGSLLGEVRLWRPEQSMHAAEPIQHHAAIQRLQFSPDGRWLLVVTVDSAVYLWELPHAEGEPPSWLPELAEAVAGLRFGENRGLQNVSFNTLWSLHQRLRDLPGSNDYAQWVRWFIADRATRSSSPRITRRAAEGEVGIW